MGGGLDLLVGLPVLLGDVALPGRNLVVGVGVTGWLIKQRANSAVNSCVRTFIIWFDFVSLTVRYMNLSAVLSELAGLA